MQRTGRQKTQEAVIPTDMFNVSDSRKPPISVAEFLIRLLPYTAVAVIFVIQVSVKGLSKPTSSALLITQILLSIVAVWAMVKKPFR